MSGRERANTMGRLMDKLKRSVSEQVSKYTMLLTCLELVQYFVGVVCDCDRCVNVFLTQKIKHTN